MSYKQGEAYKLYEVEMTNAKNLAKKGASESTVADYFVNKVSYYIAMIVLEQKGLTDVFNKADKKAFEGLMAKYKKYNPSEPAPGPFKEEYEEYVDDVEAEPPGYKLSYQDDEVNVYEEIEPIKSVFQKPKNKKSVF